MKAMGNAAEKNANNGGAQNLAPKTKKNRLWRFFVTSFTAILVVALLLLIVNALLSMFKDDYYTTIGEYRLFSIVSDSMEPTIPKGSMIVSEKPTNVDSIKGESKSGAKDGTIITFKQKASNGEVILQTHRVVSVSKEENGVTRFTTRGDNAGGNDSFRPTWSDVVGIYTGRKCGFFGSLFGFFQSSIGVSVLIFAAFVLTISCVMWRYVNTTEARKRLERAAIKKSNETLSTVNLRYDNISEITAVMDVLGMVAEDPRNYAENKEIVARLTEFINASSFELPQSPELAAILDTMPPPDTPSSLAAALSTGATLRQAEDGQTLILTTMSGNKHILLTPVQTSDGIILCQQGVRIKADISPNIEEIGITSIPTAPQFFEGQPLEKNIVYPELPQPDLRLGPEALLGGASSETAQRLQQLQQSGAMLSMPMAAQPHVRALGSASALATGNAAAPASESESAGQRLSAADEMIKNAALMRIRNDSARMAYAQYREASARVELKQTEQLQSLLSAAAPLSYDEQLKVAEYKAVHAKAKKPRPPKTPEQRNKEKQAAERRKIAKQAFLDALTPEDRELYLTEQKLSKARENAIRKLKRIESDRKILQRVDKNNK